MANLTDFIEQYIKNLIEKSKEEIIEIQRNELADNFDCAPSQINYVLGTRFTIERGYIIESRRGGGGYVRITKLRLEDNRQGLINLINERIGETITHHGARSLIQGLYENDVITLREARLMVAAINACNTGKHCGEKMRVDILKTMLIALLGTDR